MRMTISFWRNIILNNSHLLIALSIATVISCARINVDRLSDSPVIPWQILEMIPSNKQIHVILPVSQGRMIPGREMIDKIERMIVNAGSDDVDYFVCVPEGSLTAEDKRAIRIDHRKERFLEVPLGALESLTGFSGRKPGVLFLVDNSGKVIESGNILKPDDRQRFYDRLNPDISPTEISISSPDIYPCSCRMDTTVWLKNNGESDLVVYETEASCTCSSAELGNRVIIPGDSAALHIVYHNTKGKGFVSTIIVYSSSNKSPHAIRIHAD